MIPASRHQCFIYEGAPSKHLPALASVARQKLDLGFRCLYLNSPPMVAGMRSYLAALGVDIELEIAKGSLLLSAEQSHLSAERVFEIQRMIETLESGIDQAVKDGYQGLWASGDMSWELGPERDFSRLVEYEWRLEELFRGRPELQGVCLYHADNLLREFLRKGLVVHPSLFVNETLSRINPNYLAPESLTEAALASLDIDSALQLLAASDGMG